MTTATVTPFCILMDTTPSPCNCEKLHLPVHICDFVQVNTDISADDRYFLLAAVHNLKEIRSLKQLVSSAR